MTSTKAKGRSLNVLAVDDEPGIVQLYRRILGNYNIIAASTGKEALEIFKRERIDIVILDILMPGIDGREVLRQLRKMDAGISIIMVSALNMAEPAVDSLKMGACEYITKPFDPDEFAALVDTTLKKALYTRRPDETIRSGSVVMNLSKRTVHAAGVPVRLTRKEYELLKLFLQSPHRLLSRDYILHAVWGDDGDVGTRTLDTHVCFLRNKLGRQGDRIITVVGEGYKFEE